MPHLFYNQMKQMNKNFVSKESLMFFLDSYLSFCIFKWNFDVLYEVLPKIFGILWQKPLTNSAIGFVVSIKWTYPVLWVDS